MKVPFDLEMAKKITSGEMEGKIVTRKGYPSKILMFDMANIDYPICAIVLIPGVSEDCYHFAQTEHNIRSSIRKAILTLCLRYRK